MSWNIVAECVSVVILVIIWVYSRKGNLLPDSKNRLFQTSFFVTFWAMFTNILSTYLIYTLRSTTVIVAWMINTIYFIMTPLMGMVYFYYTLSYIYENDEGVVRKGGIYAIPGILYIGMVLLNPFTKWLFDITLQGGYVQGPLVMVTYVIFYLYGLLCVLMVLWKGRHIPSSTRNILVSFPLIAALVIVIQMRFPEILLSGSAATCALLLIYLFLQNKQIGIDYLTGLPNRMQFTQMVEIQMKDGGKGAGKQRKFLILVVSLREFKLINDVYGQHNGDAMLVQVAKYLEKELLFSGAICRFGGDEFALYLEGMDREELEHCVKQILLRMEKPWQSENCVCMLSCAIGIIAFPESTTVLEELINGIEYAVSTAKTQGRREKVFYCNAESLQKMKRRQQIAGVLQECLEKDWFTVHFQPIYHVASGGFPFAEALLRIEASPLGQISPGEFIPIAEETGTIIEITYLVFEKICQRICSMEKKGIPVGRVAVNLSPLQFSQRDLVPRFISIAKQYGLPFSRFEIEITESALTENTEVVETFFKSMHELGGRIALDDFGTGFSNLSRVTNMEIDLIKLDKSLIYSAMENPRSAIVVQYMTRSFKELGMAVLAEGIETEEQRAFVEACGCDYIQGYLYAKPMDGEAFEGFMKA